MRFFGFLLAGLLLFPAASRAELNLKRLPDQDIKMVQTLLTKLIPMIQDREKKKNLATLSFKELEAPLAKNERQFIRQFLKVDPKKHGIKTTWRGYAEGTKDLVVVDDQKITKDGKVQWITPQFVPKNVYAAYQSMMKAMEKDLGTKLRIESAYRSSAYQLYLFLHYLQNHDYSIFETAKWNAFPGYSEHGDPKHQALDFMNEKGINGEDNPEEFAVLPEYKWLLKNARRFGFVLSYPKSSDVGIAYEPWHWRYEGDAAKSKVSRS